jgi:hypothetical protein
MAVQAHSAAATLMADRVLRDAETGRPPKAGCCGPPGRRRARSIADAVDGGEVALEGEVLLHVGCQHQVDDLLAEAGLVGFAQGCQEVVLGLAEEVEGGGGVVVLERGAVVVEDGPIVARSDQVVVGQAAMLVVVHDLQQNRGVTDVTELQEMLPAPQLDACTFLAVYRNCVRCACCCMPVASSGSSKLRQRAAAAAEGGSCCSGASRGWRDQMICGNGR